MNFYGKKHIHFFVFTSFLLFSGFLFFSFCPEIPSAEAVLKKMHKRYSGKWYKTFTFNQTTEVFANDSLVRSETWHEAIAFPDKFRIDFGVPDSGNAVIFKGDSAYRFRRGKMLKPRKNENDLTFFLGGCYFMSFEKMREKFSSQKFDLSKFFEGNWKTKPVYVVGALSEKDSANQLWIEKERLIPVRLIRFSGKDKEEIHFENHLKLQGGWTETKVSFFHNGKLIQKEYYHNCKANPVLDERLFNPSRAMEWHWLKK